MKTIEIPKDGLAGLKQNWTTDALSGFLVFLLALPLSLGIAKASGFPAAMGVLTAMIGGLLVSIFAGSRLTIKGPAAGLITVCAAAVTDLGNLGIEGVSGVQLACGAIVVMAVIQFIFGLLKFGSYSDFFPHSAVHGMLAAIGVLIFAKQFPVLLGVDPSFTKGLTPIQLYTHIPTFIANATPQIAMVGLLSLAILFGLPALGGIFKKIPAPMIVLLVMIPLAAFLNFGTDHPGSLVAIGDFWNNVKFSASFEAIGTGVFWKYVFMFLFVNSLESLLTVKAIDGLDPFKRKSNYNKDLSALALGNAVSGALGGLPMISEVARSSANVNNGAKTRWSNFFHGFFLFAAMLLMIPVIEMIPNAALAAMLIAVAYRLASPKEFIGTYKIGPEQLVIFLVTIIVTVAEDLLLGVGAGILVKFIFHIVNGAPLGSLFKANYILTENENGYMIKVKGSATFSNFLGYKKLWAKLAPEKNIAFDFSEAKLVDHSFMDQLHHFEEDRHATGSHITLMGLGKFNPLSAHPLAARKIGGSTGSKLEIQLTPRQVSLRKFADNQEYNFYPQKARTSLKYKGFPIEMGAKILYEENFMEKYLETAKVSISDISLTEGARQASTETHVTAVLASEIDLQIPDFALEPESFNTKFSELIAGKDIDFRSIRSFPKSIICEEQMKLRFVNFLENPLFNSLKIMMTTMLNVIRANSCFSRSVICLNLLTYKILRSLLKISYRS
ncbi:MAG TPA: SulP family inorganic anion transporter [Cyclobacteriaceae bacterium]|jgi:MFS superfamily sulfate permease-like transporter|nr:SulP family inorganic anion transporter [Cyclobacteriaceae bacterium]